MEDTVEKKVEGLAEKIIAEDEERRKQELVRLERHFSFRSLTGGPLQDIFNIAPKRPNWDLKRDMEKKLSKLERRTQEAIHTLIRRSYSTALSYSYIKLFDLSRLGQRLAAQKGESDDIVGAMNAQERQNAKADDSDSDED